MFPGRSHPDCRRTAAATQEFEGDFWFTRRIRDLERLVAIKHYPRALAAVAWSATRVRAGITYQLSVLFPRRLSVEQVADARWVHSACAARARLKFSECKMSCC
jgi:hypothetical protein